MTLLNLSFNVCRSFVTMATNLPSCFFIQCLEQLLKFLVNFTLLKYVKSQRSYDFLITKELIVGFQILDLKDHFSASLIADFHKILFDKLPSIFFDSLCMLDYMLMPRPDLIIHCFDSLFKRQCLCFLFI